MTSNVTPFRNIKHVSLLWAAPERAAEIAQLHQKLFDPPWSEDSIKTMLEHPASTSLVAVTGNPKVVTGFVIGQLAADEAEILSIGVAPDWQRLGLGKKLVEGLVRAAQRGEAKRLFLEVADDNVAARKLYNALGFKELGRRKSYYQRPGKPAADALNLALGLSPSLTN
jgi:ribosomal-protein-alanine N-acetyltransferase